MYNVHTPLNSGKDTNDTCTRRERVRKGERERGGGLREERKKEKKQRETEGSRNKQNGKGEEGGGGRRVGIPTLLRVSHCVWYTTTNKGTMRGIVFYGLLHTDTCTCFQEESPPLNDDITELHACAGMCP